MCHDAPDGQRWAALQLAVGRWHRDASVADGTKIYFNCIFFSINLATADKDHHSESDEGSAGDDAGEGGGGELGWLRAGGDDDAILAPPRRFFLRDIHISFCDRT